MKKRPDVPHAPRAGQESERESEKKATQGHSERKPTVKWSERRVGERSHRRTSSGIGEKGWGHQAGEREGELQTPHASPASAEVS